MIQLEMIEKVQLGLKKAMPYPRYSCMDPSSKMKVIFIQT